MIQLITKLFATFICIFTMTWQANASSVFISSMTLISTKSLPFSKPDYIEKALFIEQEEACMALGLYHEARGEPIIGQYAVGATVLNRVRSSAYPNSVCEVVFQNQHLRNRCQFSFACDGISDVPKNESSFLKMQRLARVLLTNGIAREAKFIGHTFQASVDGMTHYHRYDVYPHWSKKLEKLSKLGAHIFFKSTRVTKRYAF